MPLIDKRAAIVTDARLGAKTNAHVVVERLLSISGEDALTVDRKYRAHWHGRLGVRVMILSNELPRVSDASGAFANRFIILVLTKSFLHREDKNLTRKLLTELPGILNWALVGLSCLRERGHFEMPRSSQQKLQELEDLSNPTGAFVADWCVLGPQHKVKCAVLYEAYRYWCQQMGLTPSSHNVFSRDLATARPQLRPRGQRPDRYYPGIDLSDAGAIGYDNARDAARRLRPQGGRR
jgi:putative DNA primase/helicase